MCCIVIDVWYKAKLCLENRSILNNNKNNNNVVQIVNQNMNMCIITIFGKNISAALRTSPPEGTIQVSFFDLLCFIYQKLMKSQLFLIKQISIFPWSGISFTALKGASVLEHFRVELPRFSISTYNASLQFSLVFFFSFHKQRRISK